MSFVVLSAEKNCTGVCVCMCVCVCCQLRMAACVGVHYSISLSFTSAPVGFPAEKGHLPVMMLLWVDAGPPSTELQQYAGGFLLAVCDV